MPGPRLTRRTAFGLLAIVAGAVSTAGRCGAAGSETPLAIHGYDPVAYFTDGKPLLGRSEFEFVWDEHRYRFTSAEHRDLFKADPARYAPQFASYCAMALTRGELDEGNPEYWIISNGKLYLFGKSFGPDRFRQALAENIAKANASSALFLK